MANGDCVSSVPPSSKSISIISAPLSSSEDVLQPSFTAQKGLENCPYLHIALHLQLIFSNPKEGLSPKSQMIPTIVQTQELLPGDLEPAGNLPTVFLPCVFTLMLSQCWAWLESALLCTVSNAQPAQDLEASSQFTEHQGIRQWVYWRLWVPGSGWPWPVVHCFLYCWMSFVSLLNLETSVSLCV